MNRFSNTITKLKAKTRQREELSSVTPFWVESEMCELDLKRSQVIQDLKLDDSTFSQLIAGKRKMVRTTKAAFYFYLKCKRMNIEPGNNENVSVVSPEWVGLKMFELNIDRSQLIKDLLLDKSTFSQIMTGSRKMVRTTKGALFFYLTFMTYLKHEVAKT